MEEENYIDEADEHYDQLEQQQDDGVDSEEMPTLSTMADNEAAKMIGISPVRVPGVSAPSLPTMLSFIRSAQPHEIDMLLEHIMVGANGPDGPISILKAKAVMLGFESVDAEFNKWQPGLIPLSSIGDGARPPMIWFGLYKRALTLLNGQSGAGKSSISYNIVLHAAVGKELWGVPFSGPQRVFYIDPENMGDVRSEKLKRIAESTGISLEEAESNIYFHDAAGMDLSDPLTAKHLGDMMIRMEMDGLILDPLANIFGTVNENDNAEAARQMKLLIDILGRTGCWILAVHHTGKSEEGGARGASARHGASFVVLDLRLAKEAEDVNDDFTLEKREARQDLVRLRKVKDRFNGAKASIFLKMGGSDAEDCFDRISYDAWMREARSGGGVSAADQAMVLVREWFEVESAANQYLTSDQVVTAISAMGPDVPAAGAIKTAMTKLASDGYLGFEKSGKGGTRYHYRLGMDQAILDNARSMSFPGNAKDNKPKASRMDGEEDGIEAELTTASPAPYGKPIPIVPRPGLEINDGMDLPLDESDEVVEGD